MLATTLIERQFPLVRTYLRGAEPLPAPPVAGGTEGLAAMLESLVLNAAEAVGKDAEVRLRFLAAPVIAGRRAAAGRDERAPRAVPTATLARADRRPSRR